MIDIDYEQTVFNLMGIGMHHDHAKSFISALINGCRNLGEDCTLIVKVSKNFLTNNTFEVHLPDDNVITTYRWSHKDNDAYEVHSRALDSTLK